MKLPVALVVSLPVLLSAVFSLSAAAQTACSYVGQKYTCDDASSYQSRIERPGNPLLTTDKFRSPLAGAGRDSALITADNRDKLKNSDLAVITDSKGMQWTGHQIGNQTVYMNGKGAKVTCQTIGSQRACI